MPPKTLAPPTVSINSNVSRAITDSLVNPKAQQFVAAPAPQKTEKPKATKDDPMTCITFTIRTSMLAKLQEIANDDQADSGELNLSRYVRGIFKRHIDKLEAAQPKDALEQ